MSGEERLTGMETRANMSRANGEPVLEVRELSKSFGAVVAMTDVSISLHRGEILGLIGDNGAGKSTLLECIAGRFQPDSGSIWVDGELVEFKDPMEARNVGIETVHQRLALVEQLDVVENLFLNRELIKTNLLLHSLQWLDRRRMRTEATRILDRLSIKVPSLKEPIGALSGGQRQAVAIGRAVGWAKHIVLLDEPTAALGVRQSEHVLDLVRRLSDQGIGVMLVSHNMPDVLALCHRIVVLRHGRVVAELDNENLTVSVLVEHMTGGSAPATN
jgi:ABC-type sugar transport system ATPase subunit